MARTRAFFFALFCRHKLEAGPKVRSVSFKRSTAQTGFLFFGSAPNLGGSSDPDKNFAAARWAVTSANFVRKV
jgi:hypothetical protein